MKQIMYKGKNIYLSEKQEGELRDRLAYPKYMIKLCSIITGVGLLLGSWGLLGEYKDFAAKRDLKINYPLQYETYLDKKRDFEDIATLIYGEDFELKQSEQSLIRHRWVDERIVDYFLKNKYLEDRLNEVKKDEDGLISKLNIVKSKLVEDKEIAKKQIEAKINEI